MSQDPRKQYELKRQELQQLLTTNGFSATPSALSILESANINFSDLITGIKKNWEKYSQDTAGNQITVKVAGNILCESTAWRGVGSLHQELSSIQSSVQHLTKPPTHEKTTVSETKVIIKDYLAVTYQIMIKLKTATPHDVSKITNRKITTEKLYLDQLARKKLLNRSKLTSSEWQYSLIASKS